MESKHLKVDNPCPFLLERMKKNEKGYYCRSCSKTIVDFREKTDAEIISSVGSDRDICGIFHRYQLKGQKKISKFRQLAFYGLAFLSFIGFSVKPLYGQTETNTTKQSTAKTKPEKDKDKKAGKKRQSPKRGHKKGKIRVVGTPSF